MPNYFLTSILPLFEMGEPLSTEHDSISGFVSFAFQGRLHTATHTPLLEAVEEEEEEEAKMPLTRLFETSSKALRTCPALLVLTVSRTTEPGCPARP